MMTGLLMIIAFCVGFIWGFYAMLYLFMLTLSQGRWNRREIDQFMQVWRGPNGERWPEEV